MSGHVDVRQRYDDQIAEYNGKRTECNGQVGPADAANVHDFIVKLVCTQALVDATEAQTKAIDRQTETIREQGKAQVEAIDANTAAIEAQHFN